MCIINREKNIKGQENQTNDTTPPAASETVQNKALTTLKGVQVGGPPSPKSKKVLSDELANIPEETVLESIEIDDVPTELKKDVQVIPSSYHKDMHLDFIQLSNSISVQGQKDRISGSVVSTANSSLSRLQYTSSNASKVTSVLEARVETNAQAMAVINRVIEKLNGSDFPDKSGRLPNNTRLKVTDQIDKLIIRATSNENLCTCFFGWCAFW